MATTPRKAHSKWKCKSCGNYNSIKKPKCPKCNTTNYQMSMDDFEMIQYIEEKSEFIEIRKDYFIRSSLYLQEIQHEWNKNIINNKSLDTMKYESSLNPCSNLAQCPCAKRAVFIQHLYRDWCKAHDSSTKKKKKSKTPKRKKKLNTPKAPKHRPTKSSPIKKQKTNKYKKQKRKESEPPSTSTKLINKSSSDVIKKEPNLEPGKVKKMGKPSMSIADIITKLLKNYNLHQLMEDCNHIDNIHCNDPIGKMGDNRKYLAIFKFFKYELGECETCNIYERSNRNRINDGDTTTRKRLYYGFINAKDVAIITTLDTYHSFWFHSYNLYKLDTEKSYKTLSTDDDDDDDDDIKEEESSIYILNASKFVTNTTSNTSSLSNFEFGEHFEYWPHYEEFQNFIPKKYNTLKQELLNNYIACIDKAIYDDICAKIDLLINTSYIKQMGAMKNFYNDIAGINEDDIITKEHLICIMVYTNHTEIQRAFKETLRLPTNIKNIAEKDNDIYNKEYVQLKEKNSQIANWCRLLFESVRFWGTIMTENDYFFHGIDRTLLFDKFYAAFKCPISTSTQISVAQNFKDNKDGIIIKITCASEKSMIPFLDVSFISDFRMESERLFYGADLNIIDIYYKKLRFDYMLRALSLFQYIVSGGFFTHNTKLINDKNQKRLISLIENYLKYHDEEQLILPKDEKKKKKKKKKNKKKNKKKKNDKPPPIHHQKSQSDTRAMIQSSRYKRKQEKIKKKTPTIKINIDNNNHDSKNKKNNKKKNNKNIKNNNNSKQENNDKNVFAQRPLSKVKSSSDLKIDIVKKKRNIASLSINIDEDDEKEEKKEKKEENIIIKNKNKKKTKKPRKYHQQLFDFCISSRQNSDVWLCRTEILATSILPRLKKYFICNSNATNTDGNFVKFWKYIFNVNVKYSQEFDWPIHTQNLDRFMKLESGDLIQSPRYIYTLSYNNESLADILFYAEMCRWSKDDPGWTDFYWNVEKLPMGVSEIQVTLDVYCQNCDDKRVISHDFYEGEWMSTDKEELSYFGGKAFEILKEFYNKTNNAIKQSESKPHRNSDPGKYKISQFKWKMSVRVSTIAYTPNTLQ